MHFKAPLLTLYQVALFIHPGVAGMAHQGRMKPQDPGTVRVGSDAVKSFRSCRPVRHRDGETNPPSREDSAARRAL